MTMATQLQQAVPTGTTAILDHADLQRRGRRRRMTRRAAAGLGGLSAIAAAAVLAVPPGASTVDVAALPGGADAGEADDTGTAAGAPDPSVVASWDGLAHGDAVDRLHASLDEHPARPDSLVDATVHGFPSAGQVATLRSDTPSLAIVDVSDDEFVVGAAADPVALVPAWTQDAARATLDSLASGDLLRYAGVVVDPDGRTVVAFETEDGQNQLWIDPESGYPVGARLETTSPSTPAPASSGDHRETDVPEPADF